MKPTRPTTSHHSVLRFITAGSVDDGKSTLIGRLLYDTKSIFTDQLDALANTKSPRISSGIDLSLLTDGLEDERELGITIDVAYRYFVTAKRKFIIADCPGHEQYTRNMVTGASTADAMIILIDAEKMKNSNFNLPLQTRRHSAIAKLLRIEHIVVAINKMDLLNFDNVTYQKIVESYSTLTTALAIKNIHYMPVSALHGDNIVTNSSRMTWYDGPPLVQLIENLEIRPPAQGLGLRMPVQGVRQQKGNSSHNLNGYMGRIIAGQVSVGDQLIVQPTGAQVTVEKIQLFNRPMVTATFGQSITLYTKEHIEISRGNMFAGIDSYANNLKLIKKFKAQVCWLSEDSLDLHKKYWLKHTTLQTRAQVTEIEGLVDMTTQEHAPAQELKLNDIGQISIEVQDFLSADRYEVLHATGSFILIDPITHQTAAAGMIL